MLNLCVCIIKLAYYTYMCIGEITVVTLTVFPGDRTHPFSHCFLHYNSSCWWFLDVWIHLDYNEGNELLKFVLR